MTAKTNQKGYAVSFVALFVLVLMLTIALSVGSLNLYRQKAATTSIMATQSYYAAEAGIEDALLRLKENPQMPAASYSLTAGNASTNVNIPAILAGSRAITSQGSNVGMIKNIQVVYSQDTQNVNFYYGIEVGEGGLQMSNGSVVLGNVFSGGNITGTGTIDNDVVISGNGHSISGIYVGGNVLAYSCLTPANVGSLTYVQGGAHTCKVRGTTEVQTEEISAQPLPIPQSQIDDWKSSAADGSVITGDYSVVNKQKKSLGPAKITGNLTISNQATLTLTGTVYVAGNISVSNGSTVKLSSSYGSLGGVLLADGIISIGNGNNFFGSGQEGSYVLVLSTNTSDSAIGVSNNTEGEVLYTSEGGISISNGVSLLEATGYKITMSNNSSISYSRGLENIYFSNGPGGSWKVLSWQEQ